MATVCNGCWGGRGGGLVGLVVTIFAGKVAERGLQRWSGTVFRTERGTQSSGRRGGSSIRRGFQLGFQCLFQVSKCFTWTRLW